jgi:predicted PurR-regulated permease PerM
MTTTSSLIIKKLLLLFLVVAGLIFAKDFLIPLAIGTVLATLFLPISKFLESKRIPKLIAVFICLLLLLIFVAGIFSLIGWQISALSEDVNLIKLKILDYIGVTQQFVFNHLGISTDAQTKLIKDQQATFASFLESIAGSIFSIFTGFILTLVYVFLLLYYRNHIKKFILELYPADQSDAITQLIYSATNVSQQYLLGLSKMIGCLWIMYGIGFSIIGVKNVIFFAVLCGLLEIIPFIGNITGTTITFLVTVVNGGNYIMLIGILITYSIIQFIQGWILEPLIVGPSVKINPLSTILALVIGELIWGIPGVVLAIPLTAMFKIICDHVEPLKPFGFLIGEIKKPKSNSFIDKIKSLYHKVKNHRK